MQYTCNHAQLCPTSEQCVLPSRQTIICEVAQWQKIKCSYHACSIRAFHTQTCYAASAKCR